MSRLMNMGARVFRCSTSSLWNSPPLHIRQLDSKASFKSRLKLYLFKLALLFFYGLRFCSLFCNFLISSHWHFVFKLHHTLYNYGTAAHVKTFSDSISAKVSDCCPLLSFHLLSQHVHQPFFPLSSVLHPAEGFSGSH